MDRIQRVFGPYRRAVRGDVGTAVRFGARIGGRNFVFSLSHKDIRRLQTRTTASAEAVLHLLTNVDVLLATILVVNNLVNICIVILVSGIIDSVLRSCVSSSCSRPYW